MNTLLVSYVAAQQRGMRWTENADRLREKCDSTAHTYTHTYIHGATIVLYTAPYKIQRKTHQKKIYIINAPTDTTSLTFVHCDYCSC